MVDFVEQVDGAISYYCDNGEDNRKYCSWNDGWTKWFFAIGMLNSLKICIFLNDFRKLVELRIRICLNGFSFEILDV